jgi:hypothetical protein
MHSNTNFCVCKIYNNYKQCSPTSIEGQGIFVCYPAPYSEFRGIWFHLKASYSDLGLLKDLKLAGR